MNIPATVSFSQPQLQSVVGKARAVVCRAAAASWSPSLGKSQPSAPQQKKAESAAEHLKSAEQHSEAAAVPAVAEVTPTVRRSRPRDDALPLSMYTPYANLPEDGRTQLETDATCDPMTRSCQTAMYVWESTCRPCWGTGSITSSSRGRGRRMSYVCPTCHGLGAVRKTSSRVIPDVNGGNGQFTAGRPPALPQKEEKPDPQVTLDRWRSRRKR